MSDPGYQVLSRRWRPRQFAEVVGQEFATRMLSNALAQGRIGHAYLFAGPRGVGKTTTARILARALNCVTGPTPTPCGECEPCVSILTNRSLDVIEIDAASNNRVEDIRDLREKVRYVSASARYKVYIVDEVHMLSSSAFNAFLKTLEEPPPNVVFLFATTAPDKLPDTILSRCQAVEFRLVDQETLAARFADLAAREGVEVEPEAIAEVARRAMGSVRDGETMLDQALASGTRPLTRDAVVEALGLALPASVDRIAGALAARDAAAALQATLDALAHGQPPVELAESLTAHARDLLVLRVAGVADRAQQFTEEQLAAMRERAALYAPADLLRTVRVLVDACGAMRRSHTPRILLEAVVVQLAEMDRAVDLGELLERLRAIEERLSGAPSARGGTSGAAGAARVQPAPPAAAAPVPVRRADPPVARDPMRPTALYESATVAVADPIVANPLADAAVEAVTHAVVEALTAGADEDVRASWSRIVETVGTGDMRLAMILEHARVLSCDDGVLSLAVAGNFERSSVEAMRSFGAIRSAFGSVLGGRVGLRKVTARIDGALALAPAPTPAVTDSTLLDRVVELFDGEIEETT